MSRLSSNTPYIAPTVAPITEQLYREPSIAMLEELVSQDVSPLKKLEDLRGATLCQGDETIRRGNYALEFGIDYDEVTREIERTFVEVEQNCGRLSVAVRSSSLLRPVILARACCASEKRCARRENDGEIGASRERIEALLRMIAP